MTVFETRGSNGHLDNDDGCVGEAPKVVEADCSLSAWADLVRSPAPTSAWERNQVNSKTRDCSYFPDVDLC